MGELIDLLIDFEKGLVRLLKDLVRRPQDVADNIITKEKKYIAPFKFYTLVISLWIIYYQVYLKDAEFSLSAEEFPSLLLEYENSYENFVLLILPFLVLFEFFLPLALVNALLFRKKKLSMVNHLSLNIYLAGLYMLLALIVMAIAYPLADWVDSPSLGDVFSAIVYCLLFGLPAIHFGFVHAKIFARPKAWNFMKPLLAFGAVMFIFMQFIDGSSFDSLVHKKIYYSSFSRNDLKASPGDFYHYRYLPASNEGFFTWSANTTRIQTGHSFTNGQYGESLQSIGYYFSTKTDTLRIALNAVPVQSHTLQVSQLSPTQVLVSDYLNSPSNPSTNLLWEINPENGVVRNREFKNRQYFSLNTRGFKLRDKVYFTSYDEKKKSSFLGYFNSSMDSVFTKDIKFPNLIVRRIDILSDSSIVALGAVEVNGKLTEIHLFVLEVLEPGPVIKKDILLYRNEFNPTKGRFACLRTHVNSLHEVYAFYQLATDSTLATHITSYDLGSGQVSWENTYKVKADFAIVSDVLFDKQYTYLLGRAASIFRKDFSLNDYCLPFIKVIDNASGKDMGEVFLDQSDNRLDGIELLYRVTSSYSDDASIYFNVRNEHSYQISKEGLIKMILSGKRERAFAP